jgi:hypothetical protein
MVSPFAILITTQQTSCKPTAKYCYARSIQSLSYEDATRKEWFIFLIVKHNGKVQASL